MRRSNEIQGFMKENENQTQKLGERAIMRHLKNKVYCYFLKKARKQVTFG